MGRKLLLSGERDEFTVLSFNADSRHLAIEANYQAPYNASWTEHIYADSGIDYFIGLSEGTDAGLLYTFSINHKSGQCLITSQQPTLGAPAHFKTLSDGHSLALATYLGGSVALYETTQSATGEILLKASPRSELLLPFPHGGRGPNRLRQGQCHIHQILEDKQGVLYAPDLGSDRVWLLHRKAGALAIAGWLQCSPGSGPRHAILSPDESMIYVLGELSHTVVAFDLPAATSEAQPIPSFVAAIVPPTIEATHAVLMDSAELCSHPKVPNVLYASGRWEKHIARHNPHLVDVAETPTGDVIAVFVLSEDGRTVVSTKHIRTKLDVIRGLRLSADGRYAIAVGQEDGGVEIYGISGDNAEIWTLVSSMYGQLAVGLKHAVWF